MNGSILPAGSRVSELALTVADLEGETGFYERTLGLEVVGRGEREVRMGVGGNTIVRLTHDPKARAVRGTARLYHFAILFPTRGDLAQALVRLVETRWPIDGASDHLVSEAIYLSDPERNGIELYRDRPREEWPTADGQIQMATLPLDLRGLVADANGKGAPGPPAGTVLGHIHLQVNDLPAAERFYAEVVGLELTARYGDAASFLAAGGYHHHVGVNVWGTKGAPPAPEGALGLRWYRLSLPGREALLELRGRLDEWAVPYEMENGELRFRDPAGHTLAAGID
jgi:catechol 2,3-dioxygenase